MEDKLLIEPKFRKNRKKRLRPNEREVIGEALGGIGAMIGVGAAAKQLAREEKANKERRAVILNKRKKEKEKTKKITESEGSFKKGGRVCRIKPKLAKKGYR